MIDPATGRRSEVENGSSQDWIDASGTVAGTNVNKPPGPGFRPLSRMP